MKKSMKNYVQKLVGAIALYIATLVLSVWLLNNLDESPWRIVAAILPVFPIILGTLAFVRFFGEMDELQKRIQLYAMAFSFGVVGMLTLTYGLLQNVGLPQVSFIAVLPAMIALWGLGYVIASAKYQ